MLLFKFSLQVKIDVNILPHCMYIHTYIKWHDKVFQQSFTCSCILQLCFVAYIVLIVAKINFQIIRHIPSHQADNLPCRDKKPPVSLKFQVQTIKDVSTIKEQLAWILSNQSRILDSLMKPYAQNPMKAKVCTDHVMNVARPNSTKLRVTCIWIHDKQYHQPEIALSHLS